MHRSILALVAATLALAACAAPSATSDAPDTAGPQPSPPATAAGEPTASASAGGPTARVIMDVNGYAPTTLTVAAGTTVVFVNEDTAVHSVSEGANGVIVDGAFVDADVEPGAELEVPFDAPGTFTITCRYHPFMNVTVTVDG